MDVIALTSNWQVQDAVMRRLQIIGEAVKKISENIKANHPNILWKDIAGMRDRIVQEISQSETTNLS